MSRKDLLEACRRLGIRTDAVSRGKRGSKDNDWLRTDILNRTYGPGMHWQFRNSTEADRTCVRAVDSYLGVFGYLLSVAQGALRDGNEALVEYKRICGFKRRKPAAEAELLRSARQWFELARITHNLYELERDMVAAGYR
jgi:hypothetical protein